MRVWDASCEDRDCHGNTSTLLDSALAIARLLTRFSRHAGVLRDRSFNSACKTLSGLITLSSSVAREGTKRKILQTWRLRHVKERKGPREVPPFAPKRMDEVILRRIATRTITIIRPPSLSPPLLASARVDEERTNYLVILFTRKFLLLQPPCGFAVLLDKSERARHRHSRFFCGILFARNLRMYWRHKYTADKLTTSYLNILEK